MKNIDWLNERVKGLGSIQVDWEEIPLHITALRRLRHNYDGDGSDPPSRSVVDGVVACLAHLKANGLPPPLTVYPHLDYVTIIGDFSPRHGANFMFSRPLKDGKDYDGRVEFADIEY